ncbi:MULTISPECIES: LysE family transporter [Brevibacillus]|jgi:cysteine/O-acetylserine efflux protein|uniref:Lysine exporter protein LysE/YggA n=1 Tax=Brevibacillus borstelensis AK1 TaxID=1300222 RepID=M8EDA9_9BACL|nr:LysE family transporter [Brevibacillus borstelensis]EMT53480.1 lysine exporter protein LysE/YggA [Brevibacillus borstelensis AK1]KKX53131.1 amino acid transporter LysE [Brevibacillus borstelensis cifa_chp40]MCM3623010.1 LysE family transporter [Brevibacillus borstelensis]MED1745337.1 LysE family transporter [Brevibacillus borstelensis]MED1852321.1 LysE family transporter [Brevibacillus borstelensis]
MPFFSLLLYAFVSSFTPGPNNIMAMVFANKYGFKKTLRFCFGVGSGFFIIMLLCSYFDLLLKSFIPKMEWIMTVLGAIYMVYLAIKLIISKQHENDNNGDQNSFITGMLLQFVNPKAILYGITIVSTFILPYHTSNLSLIGYSFFLAVIGFMGTISWSVFGSVFQRFLSKYRNQFQVVMALLLVFTAISILVH